MKPATTYFKPEPHLSHDAALFKYNELLTKYGVNKVLLPPFELPIITALSFYPELRNIRIEFTAVKSDIPLDTKPSRVTIMHDAYMRIYFVHIATQIKNGREEVALGNLDFNMQVGVLAHELGHVVDYINKSFFQICTTGLLYKIDRYKLKLERKVDTITIQHGLGYQLIEFANLIKKIQLKYPDDEYYKTYFNFYLKPSYIRALIKLLPVYET